MVSFTTWEASIIDSQEGPLKSIIKSLKGAAKQRNAAKARNRFPQVCGNMNASPKQFTSSASDKKETKCLTTPLFKKDDLLLRVCYLDECREMVCTYPRSPLPTVLQ